MIKIDRDKLKEAIEKANLQGNSIEKKIEKILVDSTLSDQKKLELCQVGKFLTLFENEFTEIIEQCESPDFIISINNRRIGLEHELILNGKNVKQIQSVKNLFKLAAKVFKDKYPNIKVLANCRLTIDNFSFKQNDKKIIVDQIVAYIYSLTQNSVNNKPDFLDDVKISKHSGVSFSFNAEISNIELLDNSTLSLAIMKKEALIEKYIANSGIQEQWLFLVIGQVSPDSYEIDELDFKVTDSRFERIYLFEDFKSKKYRLK